MSTCISRHGEFSSHTLDDEHTCTRCHVLDEDALREELAKLRAEVAEVGAALDREHGFVKRHEAKIAELRAANTELALSNDAFAFQANAANSERDKACALAVELLRESDELRLLREQRDRVLALHANINGLCAECVEWCCCGDTVRCSHGGVAWPCPTAEIYAGQTRERGR